MNAERYLPNEPFPPYTYVPGRSPHPMSDAAGHSYGEPKQVVQPLDPDRFSECQGYVRGIDLFNHGFYWEAHEVWEGLWHAAERKGTVAWYLQGLIKLAASGVKVLEGKPQGRIHLASGAYALIRRVTHLSGASTFAGIDLLELLRRIDEVIVSPEESFQRSPSSSIVFNFTLRLRSCS